MLRDTGGLLKNWLNEINHSSICSYNDCEILEDRISKITDAYCITTCNGTSALLLGMIALGLKENDEVIIPSYSYNAVKVCCDFLKLKIIFCDVSYDTLCIDPNILEQKITNNTKCVFFINHLGYVGDDIKKVKNICNERNVLLVEDSAQAFNHFNNGIAAGTFGEYGIYSFSGTKLLRCGEGGCLITKNKHLYNEVKRLRDMGIGNYTMSPLNAKLLLLQLNELNTIVDERVRIQNLWKKHIQLINFGMDSVHAVAILHEKSKNINTFLNLAEIETRYKFYKNLGGPECNISDGIFENYIELPQFYGITENDVTRCCELIERSITQSEHLNTNSILEKINKRKQC